MVLEWWERYRRWLLLAAAALFVGSSLWLYLRDQSHKTEELPLHPPAYTSTPSETRESTSAPEKEKEKEKEPEPPPPPLYVDVKGQVKNPGLYQFEPGMRVATAIEKAGGALPAADLAQINLAEPLSDGAALVIPEKGTNSSSTAASVGLVKPSSPIASVHGSSGAVGDTININQATAEELMSLPGIGEARAKAIVEYRSKQGGFRSPTDLKQIEGIGEKMYERIKDRLVVQ